MIEGCNVISKTIKGIQFDGGIWLIMEFWSIWTSKQVDENTYKLHVQAIYPAPVYTAPVQTLPVDNDINNTTVFVGNLDHNVSDEELRQIFFQFGEIVYVKIPASKGCGFVQFTARLLRHLVSLHRTSAEESIQSMQGAVIGQQVVRLSWGRSPTAKQDVASVWGQSADPNQWSAYYAYGQGYDPYALGATQDPSAYSCGAYAGYAQYSQQTEGTQDMAVLSGAVPLTEHGEDIYDPLHTPNVDQLNVAYLSVHGSAIKGRPMWQRTSSTLPQA